MLVEGKEISPELQQEFAVKGTSALRELSNVRSKYFSKEALVEMGTKRMTPAEAKVVYEGIGKKGGKVFGSFASRAELKPELWREVGDIEGMFSIESEAVLQSTVKDIFGNLKKVSKSKLRIDPESPFHIEKFTEGKWEKIAEFKGKGIGEGDVAPERAFGFDLWSKKDFQKRLGTSSAMVRGELKRKAAASIGVRQDRALGVAHKGRFKDVPDYFRHVETLAESKKGFTPKAREFLKLKEKLGIEYGTGKAKFEILPSRRVSPSIKFSKIPFVKYYSSKKSPIPSKKQPTQLSPSPSMRPSKSPSFKSPSRFISPSPSMRPSRSPSISPSRKASPSFKSPFSPSRRSPYTSPNKYISPSRKGSPSRKASPSLSPSPSMSPYLSPSPSVSPYVSPSVTSYYSYFTTKKTDDEITLIPDIELPRLERKEKKKKKPKQEFRYTPSVSAITFKIFGKAPKRITGLEQRAIVRGGKKNGKRSRKKSRSKGQRKRTDKVGIHGIRFRRLI